MNKLIKLISLIIISLSVYFIYNKTHNSTYRIINIGDKLSMGINSYGKKEDSYIDYYKRYLEQEKEKIIIDNTYSTKNQTIESVLQTIKNNPIIRKKIIDSNILFITLGYNDLIYSLSSEEEKNDKTLKKIINEINIKYKELIKEIRKYYHNNIIVVGYYTENNDQYINKGIIELNNILKKEDDSIYYIDTYNTLKNRGNYFDNQKSYYPNKKGYYEITKKIISKTLEIY